MLSYKEVFGHRSHKKTMVSHHNQQIRHQGFLHGPAQNVSYCNVHITAGRKTTHFSMFISILQEKYVCYTLIGFYKDYKKLLTVTVGILSECDTYTDVDISSCYMLKNSLTF